MRKLPFTILFVLVASLSTAQARDKAWYGFHIKAETAGFPLNPVVRSVVIDKVAPNSPASALQIQVGDEIVEAEGKAVPGARALVLWPILSKAVGESLHLRLKRANGETYRVVVTGIKKPGT